jgi:hypothetical protein
LGSPDRSAHAGLERPRRPKDALVLQLSIIATDPNVGADPDFEDYVTYTVVDNPGGLVLGFWFYPDQLGYSTDVPGTYSITVRASDSRGLYSEQQFTITIDAAPLHLFVTVTGTTYAADNTSTAYNQTWDMVKVEWGGACWYEVEGAFGATIQLVDNHWLLNFNYAGVDDARYESTISWDFTTGLTLQKTYDSGICNGFPAAITVTLT